MRLQTDETKTTLRRAFEQAPPGKGESASAAACLELQFGELQFGRSAARDCSALCSYAARFSAVVHQK